MKKEQVDVQKKKGRQYTNGKKRRTNGVRE